MDKTRTISRLKKKTRPDVNISYQNEDTSGRKRTYGNPAG